MQGRLGGTQYWTIWIWRLQNNKIGWYVWQRWNRVRIFDPWPDPTRAGRWALWRNNGLLAVSVTCQGSQTV